MCLSNPAPPTCHNQQHNHCYTSLQYAHLSTHHKHHISQFITYSFTLTPLLLPSYTPLTPLLYLSYIPPTPLLLPSYFPSTPLLHSSNTPPTPPLLPTTNTQIAQFIIHSTNEQWSEAINDMVYQFASPVNFETLESVNILNSSLIPHNSPLNPN